jgi:hypothetical protein
MKKFAAALLAIVLAAFVTLVGAVAQALAVGNGVDCDPVAGVSTAHYINAPSLSNTMGYVTINAGASYSSGVTITPNNFSSAPTFTVSPALPTGLSLNTSNGSISGTPTQASSSTMYKIQATGTASDTNGGTVTSYCAAYEINITVNSSNGGGNSSPYTMQQFTFASNSITPNASVSNLSAGAAMPGFTATASGVSSGGKYDMINIAVGDLRNGSFYSLIGATTNTSFNSFGGWNPAGTNCGFTRLSIGGVSQTASSGVTCGKLTTVSNGQTQYWVSIRLAAPTTADFSFDLADGLFTVVAPSNNDFINVFASFPDSSTHIQYSSSFSKLLNAVSPGVGSSGAADTSIALPTGIGQPIAGQTVGINATNLALNTNYSIVLRSTPQVLEQGTTSATFMNTTVTIPAGLEPGWHSITFSAVRSDGAATEQVAYFKISASGLLLQTSTEVPAELAFTAAPQPVQWTLGAILAMLGIGLVAAVYTYRRRVFEMVYVLTGSGGQYDIELVEQPKNARYLPMRSLKK